MTDFHTSRRFKSNTQRNKFRIPSVTTVLLIPFPLAFFPCFCDVAAVRADGTCGMFSFSSVPKSVTVESEVTLFWFTLFALEVRSGGVIILCPSGPQLVLTFKVASRRNVLAGLPFAAGLRVSGV